ncbi:MAG: nucleoside-diphosphate sugar epimerase/dehydratase [Dehalococcoidia bacterium]|nr:nucleoside-diphosphate sugar epimerase/dehydratase [Dehalococcoidia bacterium]
MRPTPIFDGGALIVALRGSRFARLVRRYRRPIVILVHLGLVVIVYLLSFLLRYDFAMTEAQWMLLLKTLPLLVVVRMVALGLFRLFQGLWRYASVRDVLQVIKASTAGTIVFTPMVWMLFGQQGFPAGVLVMDWAGNVLALSGIRLLGRLFQESLRPLKRSEPGVKRLLIVGAGDAGAALCREAQGRPEFGLAPVGFIDDDQWKAGASLLGIPVLGNRDDIPSVVAQQGVDTIVIAIPSASREQMRGIVERCRAASVPFRTLPPVRSILDGKVSMSALQEVEIADLLGREPVQLDQEALGRFLQGKRVLVTGAAGSIGSELARQIATFQPELLVLIDRSENQLFYFEAEFRQRFAALPVVAEVRDIANYPSVCSIMDRYRPHVIFHAAAFKHVPLMERVPDEAVRNNVIGTYLLAKAAQEKGVEKFVFISTDKAVNPTSVMGTTKRVAELLVQDMDRKGTTRFVAVRFGNVLGSNASVLPIFREQISKGGPVTVTHPEARRYFMTIPEAAQLVMQAGAIGSGGEIFVLDMGEPIRILDLARDLIYLSGHTPDKDIKIVFTGLRPGEKLYEELNFQGEDLLPTHHSKLKVLRGSGAQSDVEGHVARLAQELPGMTLEQIKVWLQALVPEYNPAAEQGATRDQ